MKDSQVLAAADRGKLPEYGIRIPGGGHVVACGRDVAGVEADADPLGSFYMVADEGEVGEVVPQV